MFQRAAESPMPSDGEAKAEAARGEEIRTEIPASSGRVAAPPKPERKGSPELLAGIKAYDDGQHVEAAKILKSALPRLKQPDQVQAHKYLAFIDCSLGRKSKCRDEFANALKIDPSFDLEPSEAGHPLWGPVFRETKQKAQQTQQSAQVKKRAK